MLFFFVLNFELEYEEVVKDIKLKQPNSTHYKNQSAQNPNANEVKSI